MNNPKTYTGQQNYDLIYENKLHERMIKNMDPFKKVELKDKVNNYKANLTKLIRIDEAKHYYNYFLAYKKNLLQTWDGT